MVGGEQISKMSDFEIFEKFLEIQIEFLEKYPMELTVTFSKL